jgi:hypothetical protein
MAGSSRCPRVVAPVCQVCIDSRPHRFEGLASALVGLFQISGLEGPQDLAPAAIGPTVLRDDETNVDGVVDASEVVHVRVLILDTPSDLYRSCNRVYRMVVVRH